MTTTEPESAFDAAAAATSLEAARRSASFVEPFTDQWPSLDLAAAYEVAALASADRRATTGAVTVGRKVGFTNRTIWERYGVHHPIWGWMYDDSVAVTAAGEVAHVDLAMLVAPRIEPEIVLRLASAVGPGATAEQVAACIEWVAFGFEIVHCHYPGWRFRAPDAVMDAALHGASRVGEPVAPWPTMVRDLASFELTLSRHDTVLGRGLGANVLDSPLHALAHLAETVGGAGIEAGEIITTGTITDAMPAAAGDRYTVVLDGLPVPPLMLVCD